MLFVQLYRMDEEYLTSQDALRRIAPSFRHVAIDRARGEKEYLKHWKKMIVLNAPKVILDSMSLEKCRTVWVKVTDGKPTDGWAGFFLRGRSEIWFEFKNEVERDRTRPLIEKLAKLLGYHVDFDEDQDDDKGQIDIPVSTADVVFQFEFYYGPFKNPPDAKCRFESNLRSYLTHCGYEFGLSAMGGVAFTRGFVRGRNRQVTEEDVQALAEWTTKQGICCQARLGSLLEDAEDLILWDDFSGWIFSADNLTEAERVEAEECGKLDQEFQKTKPKKTAPDNKS